MIAAGKVVRSVSVAKGGETWGIFRTMRLIEIANE
jgi:hypothetical protein